MIGLFHWKKTTKSTCFLPSSKQDKYMYMWAQICVCTVENKFHWCQNTISLQRSAVMVIYIKHAMVITWRLDFEVNNGSKNMLLPSHIARGHE